MNRNNMVFLKEDGSLDIDRINKLPLEEHMQMVGSMTNEQYEEFLSSIPINESKEHTKAVVVNHTMEDLIERGCVNFEDLINKLRKNEVR
ncbi:MAG: hypothetical protein HUJ93_06545 [Bacteroidales bacterium]|nr:hypothetical protein [Bacteroidales bacterium]